MADTPDVSVGKDQGSAAPTRPAGARTRGRAAVRITAIVLGIVLVLVAALAVVFTVVVHRSSPPQPGAFYIPPSPLPKAAPGTIIRTEPLSGLPASERGWKILYMSTSYTGKPTAVSGLIIVPGSQAQKPRHIVAFANGTVGVASNCAISIQGVRYLSVLHGLQSYLAAGDAAVMTDYQGLGTPGPHPYLVGKVEGEDVLDAVRAAHNLKEANAGTTFAVTGPSQGGHAALFAGQLAATYAPELKLAGVAASAPPTDLKELFRLRAEGTFGRVLAAYSLDSWSRVYGQDLESVFTPVARPIVRRMVRLCLHNGPQTLALLPLTTILKVGYLKTPPWQSEPWVTLLRENTPGEIRIPSPVFIAQGGADALVSPHITAAFARHLCSMGETVDYHVYPGVPHDAGAQSAPDAVKWIADRFAGKPAPSTC